MRKYTDADIEEARELRSTHKYSFNYLQQITGIPATTIKNWCKDEPIISRQTSFLANNARRRRAIMESELSIFSSVNNLTPFITKLITSILYWCEGAKYPASNALIFVNSDLQMMKLFIALLRKSFSLDESKFRVHLQIHTSHDYDELRTIWSSALNIPQFQFIKPTITEKKYGKHRADYIGTCTLKYQDFRMQLKLMGIYEEFARKFS